MNVHKTMSNFSFVIWREQVNFQRDNDEETNFLLFESTKSIVLQQIFQMLYVGKWIFFNVDQELFNIWNILNNKYIYSYIW
jgi:hypothetical protein